VETPEGRTAGDRTGSHAAERQVRILLIFTVIYPVDSASATIIRVFLSPHGFAMLASRGRIGPLTSRCPEVGGSASKNPQESPLCCPPCPRRVAVPGVTPYSGGRQIPAHLLRREVAMSNEEFADLLAKARQGDPGALGALHTYLEE